jgi:hypothetical protein
MDLECVFLFSLFLPQLLECVSGSSTFHIILQLFLFSIYYMFSILSFTWNNILGLLECDGSCSRRYLKLGQKIVVGRQDP